MTLPFEWNVYRGRLPRRYGMIAYLIIRYGTWASLIPTLINIWVHAPIDCEASLIALLLPFSLSTISTSLIFILRCIAVYRKNGALLCRECLASRFQSLTHSPTDFPSKSSSRHSLAQSTLW